MALVVVVWEAPDGLIYCIYPWTLPSLQPFWSKNVLAYLPFPDTLL
jgi:acyl-CoA reductase-like NAD-dependent aldehyde dehydrogenase